MKNGYANSHTLYYLTDRLQLLTDYTPRYPTPRSHQPSINAWPACKRRALRHISISADSRLKVWNVDLSANRQYRVTGRQHVTVVTLTVVVVIMFDFCVGRFWLVCFPSMYRLIGDVTSCAPLLALEQIFKIVVVAVVLVVSSGKNDNSQYHHRLSTPTLRQARRSKSI